MTAQMIPYILFRYTEGSADEFQAAVVLQGSGNGSGKLSVYTLPNWSAKYQDGESLQMAHAILEDWKRIPPEEAAAVFEDLQDMSLGPFIADQVGRCLPGDLPSVLARFGLTL
jgi:hypothetical protein